MWFRNLVGGRVSIERIDCPAFSMRLHGSGGGRGALWGCAVTVEVKGATARLSVLRSKYPFTARMRRDIRAALLEMGIKRATWERGGKQPRTMSATET